jgi:hypothetical protein
MKSLEAFIAPVLACDILATALSKAAARRTKVHGNFAALG